MGGLKYTQEFSPPMKFAKKGFNSVGGLSLPLKFLFLKGFFKYVGGFYLPLKLLFYTV